MVRLDHKKNIRKKYRTDQESNTKESKNDKTEWHNTTKAIHNMDYHIKIVLCLCLNLMKSHISM